ncbi:MAG: response regulator [Anaerolineae bacterium]|nr:response regulator [Anaerolineae bacterium]
MTEPAEAKASAPIRVVIADDHLLVREGLRSVLGIADDILLVGEASDGAEAIELAGTLSPEVMLMDLRMPRVDGMEAIRQIKARYPAIEIVILTTYEDDAHILQGLGAGARGYLLKDTGRNALFDAVRAAARGESLLPPEVLAALLAHSKAQERAEGEGLSQREQEVLRLLVTGAANREIAMQLNVTQRTVKAHVTSILNKLGVSSRTEAVAVAIRTGLVSESS